MKKVDRLRLLFFCFLLIFSYAYSKNTIPSIARRSTDNNDLMIQKGKINHRVTSNDDVIAFKKNERYHLMKKIETKLDLDAINRATYDDLQGAVSQKAAERIVAGRKKLGGKFANFEELKRIASLGHKQLEHLAKKFPKSDSV